MIDLSGTYAALVSELGGTKKPPYNLEATAAYRVKAWEQPYFNEQPLVYLIRPGHATLTLEGVDAVELQREVFVLGVARFDRASELPWEISGDTRWDVQEKMFADICRAMALVSNQQRLTITPNDGDFWADDAPWACVEVRCVIALDTDLAGLC